MGFFTVVIFSFWTHLHGPCSEGQNKLIVGTLAFCHKLWITVTAWCLLSLNSKCCELICKFLSYSYIPLELSCCFFPIFSVATHLKIVTSHRWRCSKCWQSPLPKLTRDKTLILKETITLLTGSHFLDWFLNNVSHFHVFYTEMWHTPMTLRVENWIPVLNKCDGWLWVFDWTSLS